MLTISVSFWDEVFSLGMLSAHKMVCLVTLISSYTAASSSESKLVPI